MRAVAIGFFDGVHIGHQALLNVLLNVCQANAYTPGVLTFDVHPKSVLTNTPVLLLNTCQEKCRLLNNLGIAEVTVLPFNQALLALTAQDFVKTILVERLQVAHVVIGQDFHYGAGRQGNCHTLTAMGQDPQYGFGVTVVPPVSLEVNGHKVGSRQIREAIAKGNVAAATAMLGRPFSISGTVVKGQQLGRQLGFPTANVALNAACLLPAHGVYAVTVEVANNKNVPGVANCGLRPTVGAGLAETFEVHLLDYPLDASDPSALDLYNQNLYNHVITVHLHHFIRPEQRFADLSVLTHQITQDIAQARQLLNG
jgi:riboflavin kinase / FMN adenylyltransferase